MDLELARAAVKADEAWSAELQRMFGRNAGDARFDARGYSTPELQRLHDEFLSIGEKWRATWGHAE